MNDKKAISQLFRLIILGVLATSIGILLVVISISMKFSEVHPIAQPVFYCGTVTYDLNSSSSNLDSTELKGFQLFEQNCKSCYSYYGAPLVGPGLKGIQERRDDKWIIAWVKNSKSLLAAGDSYAIKLYNQYNRAEMPPFEHLSQTDILAILSFVKAANY